MNEKGKLGRLVQIFRGTHTTVVSCPVHGAGVPQIMVGEYAYCAKSDGAADCMQRVTSQHVRVRKDRAAAAK